MTNKKITGRLFFVFTCPPLLAFSSFPLSASTPLFTDSIARPSRFTTPPPLPLPSPDNYPGISPAHYLHRFSVRVNSKTHTLHKPVVLTNFRKMQAATPINEIKQAIIQGDESGLPEAFLKHIMERAVEFTKRLIKVKRTDLATAILFFHQYVCLATLRYCFPENEVIQEVYSRFHRVVNGITNYAWSIPLALHQMKMEGRETDDFNHAVAAFLVPRNVYVSKFISQLDFKLMNEMIARGEEKECNPLKDSYINHADHVIDNINSLASIEQEYTIVRV